MARCSSTNGVRGESEGDRASRGDAIAPGDTIAAPDGWRAAYFPVLGADLAARRVMSRARRPRPAESLDTLRALRLLPTIW